MAFILKGIGDSVTGANEITPVIDAKINQFFACTEPCVVGSEDKKFAITRLDRGVRIDAGMAFAFGYFGISDASCQLNYIIPSSQTQYAEIYAEFDLSKSPQSFSIKMTPQATSKVIGLLQDDLSKITSGVYQMPLYLLTISTNGGLTIQDLRVVRNTIGEIELSKGTLNPVFETGKNIYRPLKYVHSSNVLRTRVTGLNANQEFDIDIQGRILLWQSPYYYGVGTVIPGMRSPGYLAVEFGDQKLNGEAKYYEIVIDYSPGLPDSLIKIPQPAGATSFVSGGRIHIFIEPFTIGNQMNILCYPLGTLTNWQSGDECGSGSALLISNRYPVDGKRGLFLQYIERVGNSNQAQSDCALIEIYGII